MATHQKASCWFSQTKIFSFPGRFSRVIRLHHTANIPQTLIYSCSFRQLQTIVFPSFHSSMISLSQSRESIPPRRERLRHGIRGSTFGCVFLRSLGFRCCCCTSTLIYSFISRVSALCAVWRSADCANWWQWNSYRSDMRLLCGGPVHEDCLIICVNWMSYLLDVSFSNGFASTINRRRQLAYQRLWMCS